MSSRTRLDHTCCGFHSAVDMPPPVRDSCRSCHDYFGNKESWDRLWTIVMLVGLTMAYALAFVALILALRRDRR